jgi:Tol biopolymer transport system component
VRSIRAIVRQTLLGALLAVLLVDVTPASAQEEEEEKEQETEGPPLPLKPTRRLAFDATEGTWMSVDVHPKGDRLVFDLLGDLYSLPISGGTAEQITSGMAFDAEPVFSPDGTRIAFTSDRSGSENLWIANADGSDPRQVSHDKGLETHSSPAWSADGKVLYVSRRVYRREEFGLSMYPLAGGEGVRIAEAADPTGGILDCAPSKDGRYLFYSGRSGSSPTLYFTPNWIVQRRDLHTGETDKIVTSPGGALRPVLSPDGRSVVYGTRRDGHTGLRIRNLVTGDDRWLLYPIDHDAQGTNVSRGLLPRYAVLPAGDALIIGYGGKLHRVEIASGRAEVIPFNAHVDLQIGPSLTHNVPIETGPVLARLIQSPEQSPDGHKLVFSALTRLYAADLPGGAPHRLTTGNDPEFEPTWSPDGRSIAYVTWSALEGGHVWKLRPGGKPQRLTRVSAFYSDPVFSPDGKNIYALRSSNYERLQLQEEVTPYRFSDLVRIPVEGGEATVVVHAGVGAQRPFVTHEPQRVYFTTEEGITSVRADASDGEGADRRKHVRIEGLHPWTNPGKPIALSEAVMSPDGHWLLTSMANQLYVVALPPASSEVPVVNLTEVQKLPHIQVSRLGADYYSWADGGRTITWAVGSTFFRRSFDSLDFTESKTGVPPEPAGAVEQFKMRVELPRDEPAGKVLLRGGTVISMRGEEVIPDADLLVVNDRIAAVGARGKVDVPAGTEVRDVSGRYILPGFIDTHAHWYEVRHDVLDLQNWSFLMSLAYGVTAGLDPQAMDQDMFAYQDLIEAGWMVGPRAFSVGQGMFANNMLKSPEQVDLLLERYRDYYRTPNVKSYLIGNRQQRQWVVESSARLGMLPTTEGNDDLELDLTHAIDGFHGNEHGLAAERIYEDVVRLYASTRIAYTPTLMISSGWPSAQKNFYLMANAPHDDPKVRRFMPHFVIDARTSPLQYVRREEWAADQIAEGAAKIMRAGGRIGVGSHAEFQGPVYHWEMQALAAGGMEPREVLRAATVDGSEIIGRAAELGTLEPGKYADLLVLEKNPLEDIRNTLSIRQVMKNGRLYDADTLDEIWPRQRALPPLWFWKEQLPGGPNSTNKDPR